MKNFLTKGKLKKTLSVLLAISFVLPYLFFADGQKSFAESTLDYSYLSSSNQMISTPSKSYNNKLNLEKRSSNFNFNWKFNLGDESGAEKVNYNDSSWKNIDLPHDYSISQEYSKSAEGESAYLLGGTGWYRKTFFVDKELENKNISIDFDGVYMNSSIYVNGKLLGTHPYGYSPFSFDLTKHLKFGENNTIAVKVDHKTPSSRWYSGSGIYRKVELTVTDKLHLGYDGIKIESPNLEKEFDKEVNVNTKVKIVNESSKKESIVVRHKLFSYEDQNKAIVEKTSSPTEVAANSSIDLTLDFKVNKPKLWSVKNPNLYVLRTEILKDGKVIDSLDSRTGFRYFRFDAQTGFYLNGQMMKVKGVCMHHDNGALGAVENLAAARRKMRILKDMGTNAIRVTHNPASDELLQAADEAGILICEELFDGWIANKNGNIHDYANWFRKEIDPANEIKGAKEARTWAEFDTYQTIKRGQNFPSIIMWSMGNEVIEGTAGFPMSEWAQTLRDLIKWTKSKDDTRPVSFGDNQLLSYREISQEMNEDIVANGGVVGFNYGSDRVYHHWKNRNPKWPMIGSETASAINSRASYHRFTGNNQTPDKELTSYDNSRVSWGHFASDAWYTVIKNDFVSGEFVWTGFDYLGEPTPWNGINKGVQGTWPSPKNSYFGIIDTAGLPKDSYYLYQSVWNDDLNTLHVLPVWNRDLVYKNNQGKVPVVVYSDAASVELFFTDLNGNRTSLGKKDFTEVTTAAGYKYQLYKGPGADSQTHKNLYLTWYVDYQDGSIEAVAYDKKGDVIENTSGRKIVKTTKKASNISLSLDRNQIKADGNDLSYLTIDLKDAEGNLDISANNKIKVSVTGNGKLLGLDNGKQDDHTAFSKSERNAFKGQLVAIVQAGKKSGDINVKVEADGFEAKNISIKTEADLDADTKARIDYYTLPINYYVLKNSSVKLPKQIEAHYSDDTNKVVNVTWEDIDKTALSKVGYFSVKGKTEEGDIISVNVNVIEKVEALLNSSMTIGVGQSPNLPKYRPCVMADGSILDADFPVTWEEVSPDSFKKPGTVVVKGKSNVLGRELDLTCTVRVQEEKVSIAENVADKALTLTQNIEESLQSDTLKAIIDGSTKVDFSNAGGTNYSAWTNYKAAQNGINTAEITLSYATQQAFGEFVVHFMTDEYSAFYPDPNTTEFYVSDTGADDSWKKVETTESIGEAKDKVKAYTYSFKPLTATFVKLVVKSPKKQVPYAKTCLGITELELKRITSKFTTYSSAELESLNVNGKEVAKNTLNKFSYKTEALLAEVLAKAKDNAAITILPAYNNVVRIIIEAEDKSKINVFKIYLGEKEEVGKDDDSRDIPRENTKIEVDHDYGTDKKENALDGDYSSLWHTNWNVSTPESKRWAILILDKETEVDALRYYSRNNGPNGRVLKYAVDVSTDKNTWTQVASGDWANEGGWKIAEFTPVKAKYVRLRGIKTGTDAGIEFMSAAELRVRQAIKKIDLANNEQVKASLEKDKFTLENVSASSPVEPKVTVTYEGKALREKIDYIVKYENNDKFGPAKAIIEGIVDYKGKIELDFTIEKKTSDYGKLAGWKNMEDGWHYVKKDGKEAMSEWLRLPIFDKDGKEIRKIWKYFDRNGKNIEKFYHENNNTHLSLPGPDKDYAMGWYKLGRVWTYYEGSWGKMVKSSWRFLNIQSPVTNAKKAWKYFDSDGFNRNSLYRENGSAHYALTGPNTFYHKGWKKIGDSWAYFLGTWGEMAHNQWLFLNINPGEKTGKKVWKYFSERGYSATKLYSENQVIYLSPKGPNTDYLKGWQVYEGQKYYFYTPSARAARGRANINGRLYSFTNNGVLIK